MVYPLKVKVGSVMYTESKIIRTMRLMAWERAKGEMHSILEAYWCADDEREEYKVLSDEIKKFIKTVESRGL